MAAITVYDGGVYGGEALGNAQTSVGRLIS
jgi:hypothetical protein